MWTPDGINNDNLEEIIPGWGYWVLANNETVLTIDGNLLRPATTPPGKNIVKSWNLLVQVTFVPNATAFKAIDGYLQKPKVFEMPNLLSFPNATTFMW